MDNVTRSAQGLDCLGTKQAMGIGDDADQDRQFSVLSTQFSALSSQHSVLSTQFSALSSQFSVLGTHFFIFSTKPPMLTTARPTVPRPISWTSSRAVTRRV